MIASWPYCGRSCRSDVPVTLRKNTNLDSTTYRVLKGYHVSVRQDIGGPSQRKVGDPGAIGFITLIRGNVCILR